MRTPQRTQGNRHPRARQEPHTLRHRVSVRADQGRQGGGRVGLICPIILCPSNIPNKCAILYPSVPNLIARNQGLPRTLSVTISTTDN